MTGEQGYLEGRMETQQENTGMEEQMALPENYESCNLEQSGPCLEQNENWQQFEQCTLEAGSLENENPQPDYESCALQPEEPAEKEALQTEEMDLSEDTYEPEQLEIVDEAQAFEAMNGSLSGELTSLQGTMEVNNMKIDALDAQAVDLKNRSTACFSEVTKLKFGTPEYQEKLSLYNALRQQERETNAAKTDLQLQNAEVRGRWNRLEEYQEYLKDVEIVDPAQIQGYSADDEKFWEMHSRTEQDYLDLANRLPEVNRRLANGELPEDLEQDPELGDATRLYYSQDRMIRVSEENGVLQFDSDGRHRIEAAKRTGHKIPVHITRTGR